MYGQRLKGLHRSAKERRMIEGGARARAIIRYAVRGFLAEGKEGKDFCIPRVRSSEQFTPASLYFIYSFPDPTFLLR